MEKDLNEKYEVIINSKLIPQNKVNLKHGEVIPHSKEVAGCHFYYQMQHTKKFIQVLLPKEMILDLADQIKKIESRSILTAFDEFRDAPF